MDSAALDNYITGNWGEDSIDDGTMALSELTLIERYRAPQYLIDVIADCDGWEVKAVTDIGFEVIDTEIKGWGSHNAIIRCDDRDYLATIISDKPELTPETIRALRARMGLTQAALAEMIGCSQEALSMWENGKRSPVGLYAVAVRRIMAIAPSEPKTAAVR